MKNPPVTPATPVPLRGIFTIIRSLRSGRKDITPVTPLILIIAGLLVASIPQTLQAGWIRTYGGPYDDYGYWVEQTTDGSYIVTGNLTVEGGAQPEAHVYLIKTDNKGDTLWTRAYSGYYAGHCVQQTSDGGYVVLAKPPVSGWEFWLLKTDENGDILWEGYTFAWPAYGCVRETQDGDYLIVTSSPHDLTYDVILVKLNSEGEFVWGHYYGGAGNDGGLSLQLTPDGGCIIAGYYERDLWLLKIDLRDPWVPLWTRRYSLGEGEGVTIGFWVQSTSDGGYVITGVTNTIEVTSSDLFILKTDTAGDSLWARIYGGSGYSAGYSIQQTPDGGYIITGRKEGEYDSQKGALWLLKTDDQGDTIWTRTFGSTWDDCGRCIRVTSDGGYIIAGYTRSYNSDGSIDLLLIKTDSLGRVEGIEDEPVVDEAANWQLVSSIGHSIVLEYHDFPQGFHASIFDATGRRVDEIESPAQNGVLTWGENHSPGVYFIVLGDKEVSVQKVILIE